ncbi:dipeptide/oligopeptide/nickel ABC transporter ATP-binding protein [Paraoerskovia sediminicola]|uniref:Dipeptide/oligopeptide/nickel ABC transporter ATP-binding protein n=1 Tax=Paraoerskovia sediminicola TaxID=1138587 RepID=A0ABN6X9Q1_9CELL|nr:ABC transporter ATP-binding protein [Paraoerskovia sediminicola]BDZ41454.1 dipeptide/oligopeptide/nickel ABC transporter ATP-binding protein [Paraoerskovia sediminicola]
MSAATTSPAATPAAAKTGDPVLEIKNLSVDYGFDDNPTHVLRQASLTLNRGEVLGLAGESGCGKSTLAYGATRLLPPPGLITGGEVIYHDRDGSSTDILKLNDAELRASRWRDMSIVFQGAMNSLNPVYRIGKQISDGILAHSPGMSKAQAMERSAEMLEMVGISADRLRSYPHQLSGGMRQRVMIAMALSLDPQVLIMDEPTTALDVVMQRQIIEQIADLRERLGFSVIFITHDVSLLIEIADRIAIMYAGEIVEKASSQDMYRRPRHPYTDALLHSFPPLRGPRRELGGIPGSPPDLSNLPSGCPFRDRCAFAFDACSSITPELIHPGVGGDAPTRQVACLRHDTKAVVDAGFEPQPLPEQLVLR